MTSGTSHLVTNLIVPGSVGFNIPIRQTIWIEYKNTGDAAMPAPLLMLHGDHAALMTTDPDLAIPFAGFSGYPAGVRRHDPGDRHRLRSHAGHPPAGRFGADPGLLHRPRQAGPLPDRDLHPQPADRRRRLVADQHCRERTAR